MKATVSEVVVEDLKFKISEGSDQNWCFPDSAQLAVYISLYSGIAVFLTTNIFAVHEGKKIPLKATVKMYELRLVD